MKKADAKNIAKEILMSRIAAAYYKLEDLEYEGYSDDEKELIVFYINKLGERMGKAIGEMYYTV